MEDSRSRTRKVQEKMDHLCHKVRKYSKLVGTQEKDIEASLKGPPPNSTVQNE